MQIPFQDTTEDESNEYAKRLANYLFSEGYEDFDIYVNADPRRRYNEVTYDGDDFYEEFGVMWYNEDEEVDEAEYPRTQS